MNIITPEVLDLDRKIKGLAIKFTEMAQAQGYNDKELVAALALAAGAAIRARWPFAAREGAFNGALKLMKLAKDQV